MAPVKTGDRSYLIYSPARKYGLDRCQGRDRRSQSEQERKLRWYEMPKRYVLRCERRLFFQNFSLPPFPGRVENKKCYEYLRLLNIFKNVLHIMIEVLGLYKRRARRQRVAHNLVFLFQKENWLHGRKLNIEYLWKYATDFFHSFTMCFGK